jgi:hypothetical protein
VTLTVVQFLPNVWYTMRSTRWNKFLKTQSYLILWWYECWCYWRKMQILYNFIMGQIVAMETSVTSTVSLRMFGYWTGIFVCGLHICVQNLSKIGQQLAILQNWPWPKKCRPPALGKVIEPRSNTTKLSDCKSNLKHFDVSRKSLWWLVNKLCPHL